MLTVVMPAHNEQAYLAAAATRVVDTLRSRGEVFEVVVVENGSTDATPAVAAKLAGEHPEVRDVCLPEADYGAALREGILAARSGWVAIFDVDYVDLGFLSAARAEADRTGAAVVVGSKRAQGAEDRRSRARKAITAGFSLLLRVGFRLQASDTHGLKLLDLTQLRDVVVACRHSRDIFDTELVLRAERAGLLVAELPVHVEDQRPPRSSIAKRIPRTLSGLARLRVTLWKEGQRRPQ